jgi:hypothetical protein
MCKNKPNKIPGWSRYYAGHVDVLLGSCIDPEDGHDISLLNVRWLSVDWHGAISRKLCLFVSTGVRTKSPSQLREMVCRLRERYRCATLPGSSHCYWVLSSALCDFDRLCGLVAKVPGCRSRGPGSILGYQIFWEVVGLERGPLSLVSTIEELLEGKSSGSGLESLDYDRKDPSRWPRGTLHPQKLTLTSPTSGGRSV